MYYLVDNDNRIIGFSPRNPGVSSSFNAIYSDSIMTMSITLLYYDSATDSIEYRPPRPSRRHFWNHATNEWVDLRG
jgi:hypothetical protein